MTTSIPRSQIVGAADAAEAAADRNSLKLSLPLVGRLHLPPPEHLAFYVGLGALAVLEVVEWPVAAVLAVGKALADNRSHAGLRGFGEALESS